MRDARKLLRIIHPDDVARVTASTAKSAQTLAPLRTECRIRHPGKGEIWIEGRAAAVREPDGGVQWYGALKEIADPRTPPDEDHVPRQMNVLADSIPHIIWSASPSGSIENVNHRGLAYTGARLSELAGWNWEQWIHPEDRSRVRDVWSQTLKSGQSRGVEYRLRRSDGEYRWHLARAVPVRSDDGTIVQWVGTLTDIHDLRQATEQLRRTSELLTAVADGTTDAVFVKDRSGKYLFFNEAAAQFVGRRAEDVLGKDDTELFDADGARRVMEQDRCVMESARAITTEEVLCSAGVTRTYLATKAPYRDEAGRVQGLIGISRDISERKLHEQKLRASEDFNGAVLDSMSAHIAVLARDGTVLVTNAAWNRCARERSPTPIPRSEIGTNYLDDCGHRRVSLQGDPESVSAGMQAVLNGQRESFSLEYACPDLEQTRWFLMTVTPLCAPAGGAVVAHTEVTARIRAEEAVRLRETELHESDERLRLAIEAAQMGTWERDLRTGGLVWSNIQERMNGFEPGAFPGTYQAFIEMVHPDDLELLAAAQDRARRNGGKYEVELRFRRPDGRLRWGYIRGQVLFDERGDPQRIIGVELDITDQRLATERLRASEERFRALVENCFEGVNVLDAAGQVVYSGPGNERILGYSAVDVQATSGLRYGHPDDLPLIRSALSEIQQDPGAMATLTFRVRARDGNWRWIEASARNLLDHPAVRGIVLNWRDVTRRKQAEDALRQSEQRLKLALAATELGVWEWDLRTKAFFWSPECCKILGVGAFDETHESLLRFVHAKDAPRISAAIKGVLKTQTPFRWEFRIVRPSGEVRWVSCHGEVAVDPRGTPQRVIGTIRDVSRRRRAQADLKRQKTQLQLIFDAVPALIFFKDRQHRLVRVNREVTRLVGIPRHLLEGRTDRELGSPHAERYYRDEDDVISTGRAKRGIIEPVMTSTGVRWLQTDKLPYRDAGGRITGVLGFSVDITERKLAEEKLLKAEQFLRAVIQTQPECLKLVDVDGTVLEMNAAGLALVEADSIEAVRGRSVFDLVAPEHRDRFRAMHDRVCAGSKEILEFEIIGFHGRRRWMETHAIPFHRDQSAVPLHLAITRDITDRKIAQNKAQRFVSNSPAVIYVFAGNPEGLHPAWITENVGQLTGYDVSEALVSDWWQTNIHPDDRQRVLTARTHPDKLDRQFLKYRFRHKNGSYLWLRDQSRLIRDPEGRLVEIIGSWSDITEWVSLEDQLRQSQKMEAIGKLAGGVAHDFNNLLTVVQNYTAILKLELPVDDPRREYVNEIQHAANRATALTRQLLAFSRKQVLERRVVDLNDIIRGIESMVKRLIGEHIALCLHLAPVAAPVSVDSGQMEQVLVNLVVNARDAMPTGGRLAIATEVVALPDSSALYGNIRQYLRLTVSDNGCGMDSQLQSRIFEPFFTTKPPDKGSGLGLSTVFGIVTQFDGQITVSSEPAAGTTFQIDLPLYVRTEAGTEPLLDRASLPRNQGTILIVDDDDAVRHSNRLILLAEGYQVLAAAGGDEALQIIEERQQEIDLVLTDLNMPGMTGWELAESLSIRHQNLPVLLMSGSRDTPNITTALSMDDRLLLEKPFSPQALVERVRRALVDDH